VRTYITARFYSERLDRDFFSKPHIVELKALGFPAGFPTSRKPKRKPHTWAVGEGVLLAGRVGIFAGSIKSINTSSPTNRGSHDPLRHGLTKVAVYRDDDGTVHSVSAVCVHLGCIVT
jgi:hypothetical protein